MDLSGVLGHLFHVFTLNPAFVDCPTADVPTLVALARSGDCEAYSSLCRTHETRLLRQALTLCGNSALAEDLAQDTLVEGWKSLRRYNGKCQFFTWLCAILLNRYRNTLRRRRPLAFSSLPNHDRNEIQDRIAIVTDPDWTPDQLVQRREQAALVLECLERLPAHQQQVVYLRFYADQSLEGIADALSCSLGTVKSRLFRALESLRSMNALAATGLPNSQRKTHVL